MSHGPSIAIRCESRAGNGFGHLTRMIALAEALRRGHGARVRFLCDPNPMVERFLRPTNFLHTPNCRDVPEEEFLRRETESADLLIVDSKREYSKEFVRVLRERRRVIFIDPSTRAPALAGSSCSGFRPTGVLERATSSPVGLHQGCPGSFAADLTIFPCAALSPDISADPRWNGAVGALLHGAEFVLLSGNILELWQCRGASLGASGPIVLSTGGCDPQGVMLTVLPWLAKIPAKREIDVLVGDAFLYPGELEILKSRLPAHVRFSPYSEDRLAGAAIAVCTFGVTTYELMYLGIPSLVIGHSRENAETSRMLAERCGATIDCGYIGDLSEEKLIGSLVDLLENPQRRGALARAALEQVDGLGAARIAQEVIALVS